MGSSAVAGRLARASGLLRDVTGVRGKRPAWGPPVSGVRVRVAELGVRTARTVTTRTPQITERPLPPRTKTPEAPRAGEAGAEEETTAQAAGQCRPRAHSGG